MACDVNEEGVSFSVSLELALFFSTEALGLDAEGVVFGAYDEEVAFGGDAASVLGEAFGGGGVESGFGSGVGCA